jgi:hypothetical protein
MLDAALAEIEAQSPGANVRVINANDLHIVKNLSCYANGKKDCANPASGPYRCWAHSESVKHPEQYGGVDQMPVIYDALAWADVVVFSTSVRWGSHSALAQKVIERMDTLENRGSSWGEPYPMRGKRLGVHVAGLHWRAAAVGQHLAETLRWWGFDIPQRNGWLAWQRSDDPYFEHPNLDLPYVERWLDTREGKQAIHTFASGLVA